MCDELYGDYPKDFLWTGWHPRCRCSASPILVSQAEMLQIAQLPEKKYNEYKPQGLITDMPENFNEWLRVNEDRLDAAAERGKLPFFLRDNKELVL